MKLKKDKFMGKEKSSNAEKPISLNPLEFDEALFAMLKVKPELKTESEKKRKPKKEEK